jgi:hypothetical protein
MVHPLVQWLIGLSTAIFMANQILSFYRDHIREKPTASDTYATKKEMAEAHGRMSRERKDIDSALDLLRAEDRSLRAKLEFEIADIGEKIIENGRAGEARVVKLHDRLDELPDKILDLLRKTKGLL